MVSAMPSHLQAADKVLCPLLWTALDVMELSKAPEELRALEGKGVTIDPSDEPDGSPGDYDMLTASTERAQARIDVKVVLRDALSPYGLSVGDETEDGKFLNLAGDGVSPGCDFYFLLDNNVPPYAVRAISRAALCVVLHTNQKLSEDYNDTVAHAIGVHVLRLKDAESLDSETSRIELKRLAELHAATLAGGIHLYDGSSCALDSDNSADPTKVAEYASSAQDDLFEAAIAQILSPLSEGLIVLGNRFRGKPVPDGLVIEGYRDEKPALTIYDCKSKEEDLYELDASDADQQTRYLNIPRALVTEKNWQAYGVALFTPNVDSDQFQRKIIKSPWTSFKEAEGRMVIVPAKFVLKWHLLTQNENPYFFKLLFSTHNFWRAVTQQVLCGVAEPSQAALFPDRSRKIRLMTEADCELCWLAGFASITGEDKALQVASSIRSTDPGRINTASLTRPRIISRLYEVLNRKEVSLESVAGALKLTEAAVKYLLLCDGFHSIKLGDPVPVAYTNFVALKEAVEKSHVS